MNNKELVEARDQLKKEILDLDHQIHELETFYIEDTREYVLLILSKGNLLKGFENYIASKTARNQPTNKKQKVENFERIFSLSSIKSKISQIYEESYVGEAKIQSSQVAPKRNRNRPLNKNGKNLMGREEAADEEDENSVSGDNVYSMQESNNKAGQKRKKITKGSGKGTKKM